MTHTITWTLDRDGAVTGEIGCNAAVGASCRLTCPEECEYFSLKGHEHPLVDAGECMLLPWLSGLDDIGDAYVGEGGIVARSGVIDLTYDSEIEGVSWSYPQLPPAREVARIIYPVPVGELAKIVAIIRKMHGDDLVILTDHPDATQWLIVGRPEEETALAASTLEGVSA